MSTKSSVQGAMSQSGFPISPSTEMGLGDLRQRYDFGNDIHLILTGQVVDLEFVHHKVFETKVNASPEEVWKFHSSAKSLEILTPRNRRARLVSSQMAVEDDALHVMQIRLFGIIPVVWKARISQVTPPYGFTDDAEKSPFKFWRHRHDFIPDGDGTLIRDRITYAVPFGILGKLVNKVYISKDIDGLFAYRHEATKKALAQAGRDTR